MSSNLSTTLSFRCLSLSVALWWFYSWGAYFTTLPVSSAAEKGRSSVPEDAASSSLMPPSRPTIQRDAWFALRVKLAPCRGAHTRFAMLLNPMVMPGREGMSCLLWLQLSQCGGGPEGGLGEGLLDPHSCIYVGSEFPHTGCRWALFPGCRLQINFVAAGEGNQQSLICFNGFCGFAYGSIPSPR